MFKGILPKKKIKNVDDLKEFIQQKSAWVSQVTLYNYLKTRMGTKWVLHFDDEKFSQRFRFFPVMFVILRFIGFSLIERNLFLKTYNRS